jgi:hypothetical protein
MVLYHCNRCKKQLGSGNVVANIDKIVPLSDHHLNKAKAGRLLSAVERKKLWFLKKKSLQ